MLKLAFFALAAAVIVCGVATVLDPAAAADLTPTPKAVRSAEAACGPCGCLRVQYVYHRELRTTFGTGFDPRNFDQTEPYYYFGAMRPYPRFSCEADPIE
jgi:hypothetical protein